MEYMSKEQIIDLLSKPSLDNYKMTAIINNNERKEITYVKDNNAKIIFNEDSNNKKYIWIDMNKNEASLVIDGEITQTQEYEKENLNINERFIKNNANNDNMKYKYEKRENVNGMEYIVIKMIDMNSKDTNIIWINAETGIIEKEQFDKNNGDKICYEYKIEMDVVQDSDVAKPNV